MTNHLLPRSPLPPPLCGVDKGTFAEHTISERLPGIARRTAQETALPKEIQQSLHALADEMPYGKLRSIKDPGLDVPAWDRYLAPYQGQDWLTPPWFFVETYFFRRILEASGYFQPGPGGGIDPYSTQKERGLRSVAPLMAPVSALVDALLCAPSIRHVDYQLELTELLRTLIWGNQADLSIWPVGEQDAPQALIGQNQVADDLNPLLCDHASQAAGHLLHSSTKSGRIDLILDNSGVELAFDLALADFLLSASLVDKVFLHVKPYPTYVSDATEKDVLNTIDHLAGTDDPATGRLATRLQEHLAQSALCIKTHQFWVSPLSGWEMPADLRTELANSDLLFSKGDANYRRWFGDRHWSFAIPLNEVLNYLPAPWLALRILKSNMAAGMPPGKPEAAAGKDPHWLYNGQWGVIQFVNPLA
jgi:uncharacterized protein with ATP-grasp and redox domains